MTTPATGGPTSQDLLRDLLAQGLTKQQIAAAIGRSPRYLRFILNGEKPGNHLAGALSELARTGTVSIPPPRRVSAAGAAVPIRAPGGRTITPALPPPTRLLPPAAPGRKPAPAAPHSAHAEAASPTARSGQQPAFSVIPAPPGRNTLRHHASVHPSGRELHRITVPKRINAANRAEGNKILQELTERAGAAGRRLHATVWVEAGAGPNKHRRAIRIGGHGGYDAQRVCEAIAAKHGDGFGWLATQIEGRYPEFEQTPLIVTGIDVDIW